MKIVFATSCHPGSFNFLKNGGFEDKINDIDYPFNERWIILNNGDEDLFTETFKKRADKVIVSSKMAYDVLNFFKLDFPDFQQGRFNGYLYSIAPLTQLFLAKDFDYVCYMCPDVRMARHSHWIEDGLKSIKGPMVAARPRRWPSPDFETIKKTQVFSDHCYLIPTGIFRNPDVYKYKKTKKEFKIFSWYGGDNFEVKISKFLYGTHQYEKIIGSGEIIHSDNYE